MPSILPPTKKASGFLANISCMQDVRTALFETGQELTIC